MGRGGWAAGRGAWDTALTLNSTPPASATTAMAPALRSSFPRRPDRSIVRVLPLFLHRYLCLNTKATNQVARLSRAAFAHHGSAPKAHRPARRVAHRSGGPRRGARVHELQRLERGPVAGAARGRARGALVSAHRPGPPRLRAPRRRPAVSRARPRRDGVGARPLRRRGARPVPRGARGHRDRAPRGPRLRRREGLARDEVPVEVQLDERLSVLTVGRACLLLAVGLCLYGAAASLAGVRRGRRDLVASGRRSVYALALVLTVAFAILEAAFLRSDFTFRLVGTH